VEEALQQERAVMASDVFGKDLAAQA
jgi:hypothetical protein